MHSHVPTTARVCYPLDPKPEAPAPSMFQRSLSSQSVGFKRGTVGEIPGTSAGRETHTVLYALQNIDH